MTTTTTHIDKKEQLVPTLRFKEFVEEWESRVFGEYVLESAFGPRFSSNLYSKGGRIATLRTTDMDLEGNICYETMPTANLELAEVKDHILENNDIVISRSGTIGITGIYEDYKIPVIPGAFLIRFRIDANKLNSHFIKHKFNSDLGRNLLTSLSAGGVQKNLTGTSVKQAKLNIPSLPEQQKIAAFLSAVDEKIQQLTRKKELLEQYKKGVMQKLFSQEIQFKQDDGSNYPNWEEKRLGELIEICSSKRVLQEDWKDEGVPFLRTREIINLSNNVKFRTPIFISETLFEELKTRYGVPKSDDILATGVGTIGELYIVHKTDRFYFKDGNVLWFKMNGSLDSNYVSQLFKTRFIRKQLFDNASITTVATFTIEGANKTKIIYPCIKEQQKIADYLSAIDNKIESVNNQITQTQTFKKGLLQQMFV